MYPLELYPARIPGPTIPPAICTTNIDDYDYDDEHGYNVVGDCDDDNIQTYCLPFFALVILAPASSMCESKGTFFMAY